MLDEWDYRRHGYWKRWALLREIDAEEGGWRFVEETRQALLEAKIEGIHPFCITIGKAEHSYLAHMYGHASYVFIDDLTKLPLKIPEIYRKLTT